MKTTCNICGEESVRIFDALILKKYKADYFQCGNCGFIQTEKPYWLSEAYVSAITSIDVGLVYRNLLFSNLLPPILDLFSTEKDSYIDYGGGYGMFVRLMRDKGYDFYLHDMYAENLFAKYFELKDYAKEGRFAALTAFEVFEHLEDPVGELKRMFELSDTVIFSTDLQPEPSYKSSTEWWYFMPETGQHVSFYSKGALRAISEKYNCNLYTNGYNLHIFTKLKMDNPFENTAAPKQTLVSKFLDKLETRPKKTVSERDSLLERDFELYKSKMP